MTTQEKVKIVTTIGKIAGLATAIAGYANWLPAKYAYIGIVCVLVSSVCKDVLASLNSLWGNTPST